MMICSTLKKVLGTLLSTVQDFPKMKQILCFLISSLEYHTLELITQRI